MYYYIETVGVCEVGFFSPSGYWMVESHHETRESAAARVHYLNGGVGAEVVGQVFSHIFESMAEISTHLSNISCIISDLNRPRE